MKVKSVIHYSRLSSDELKEIEKKNTFKSYFLVIVGTIIYSFAFVWMIQLGGYFAGGISGISQLIIAFVNKFSTNEIAKIWVTNNLGTFVFLFNIPLLILGWKGVSKRFAILTLISIIIQSILMNLLSTYTVSPFVILLKGGEEITNILKTGNGSILGEGIFDLFSNSNYHFFKVANEVSQLQITLKNTMLPGTRIILAVFGGVICGLGCGMALKGGGSSGGVDIVANYIYSKKNISFTKVQIIIDSFIICLSSIISVENVFYTLIRLFSYSFTEKSVYKAYDITRLEIITEKGNDLADAIIKTFKHGVTVYKSLGGYTHKEKDTLVIYSNDFEVQTYINFIKDFDEKAFITISHSSILRSNFIQHTIC